MLLIPNLHEQEVGGQRLKGAHPPGPASPPPTTGQRASSQCTLWPEMRPAQYLPCGFDKGQMGQWLLCVS